MGYRGLSVPIPRSKLAQEDEVVTVLPVQDFRDASYLDHAIAGAGSIGVGTPVVLFDLDSASVAARIHFCLPPNYVAGQTLKIKAQARFAGP